MLRHFDGRDPVAFPSGLGVTIMLAAANEEPMAGHGRNDPCICGSGREAKRCCGLSRGPGSEELERSFLAVEARRAAPELAEVTRAELSALFDQLVELPSVDLSLVLRLPALLTPDLQRFLDTVAEDDAGSFDECFQPALACVDTIQARATLARAILDLRAADRVTPGLAALAVVDLEGGDALLGASLIRAAAIATGAARTPGGLLMAAA